MTDIITPDVHLEPWSTAATVIVDVASVAHWVRDDVRQRVAEVHKRCGVEGEPPGTPLAMMTRGLHRVVGVLEHHGVRTARLMLGTTLGAFPPDTSGWCPSDAADDDGQARWRRQKAIEGGQTVVARVTSALEGRGIEVVGLPGLFGSTGEHCVDELCVLAAAHASWTGDGSDVIVVSRDADVAVAPLLAGRGRILLARRMNAQEAAALADRGQRYGNEDGGDGPAHLRLLSTAMRGLLLTEDLPEGRLSDHLAMSTVEEPAPVELASVDGRHLLRNTRNVAQVLSSPLDVPLDRSWTERRRPLLDREVAAVAVVDPFGLLAAANRSGIPGRVPTAASVAAALAPLALPAPLGQLAVVPDLLDADHGLIAVARSIGGTELVPSMRVVLTDRLRRSLAQFDDEMESTIDSYLQDDLPETVATPSQFARGPLTRIADKPASLEEKESAVLLAADVLWALVSTGGPVVLVSERTDLVALLDLMDRLFGLQLGMRGRLTRVGFHADPFSGEGVSVERSGATTRWPTVLMTGRMIVDLLRIADEGDAPTGGDADPTTVSEAVAFDPTIGAFAVRDLDGRRIGEITMQDIIQFPVEDVDLMNQVGADATARVREVLARDLQLHIDLRRPLPRPLLAREGGEGLARASMLSARVVGHRDGRVLVRVTSSSRAGELLNATTPELNGAPAFGTEVAVLVDDDGEHVHLAMSDLGAVPHPVGRPRPARVIEDGRAVLIDPLDPSDLRDDSGQEVELRPLFGPFPLPAVDEVVLVTSLDARKVQAVSTPLPWVAESG
jgi:hypothetical protein